MPLFRWRFGPRNSGTPAIAGRASQDGADDDNNNPPPSYEESQNASLRTVLQGAIAVAPILWPSACSSLNAIGEDLSSRLDAGEKKKGKQNGQHAIFSPSAEESAIIEVLTCLAMTPCGDHPFLDRIRDFSDLYLTPYIASDGAAVQSSSPQGGNSSGGSHCEAQETVPVQERLRKALQHLEVPRESSALVLCARVLEEYYAGLGHMGSIANEDIADEMPTPYSQFSNEKAASIAEAAKGRSKPSPTLTSQTKTKTRLTQIVACLEEDCTCCDYDQSQPKTDVVEPFPSTNPSCNCGHPRTSHTPSPLGISRLLRRYTNWDCTSYNALKHRSSIGTRKRRIHDIRVCGVSGGCPCRDYDKGPRTGRCARCGHYDKDHIPVKPAQTPDKKHGKKKEKGKEKEKDGPSTTGGNDLKNAEWELSWILVENAYLLLNRITPISGGKIW
ncbi:hypothetical protein F4680DRAFT_149077 [Xylaria scruposa]|nr:hypothetical protein F4680DRAFT_149077 [Xylaria scruposa]